MNIDYEVNADENGYRVLIKKDGKKIHESHHERNEYGAKQVSGDKDDHQEDEGVYELLQSFLPFEIFCHCRDTVDAQ